MIINVSNWFQHVLGLIPQGQPQGNVTSCILAKCVGLAAHLVVRCILGILVCGATRVAFWVDRIGSYLNVIFLAI